MPTLREKIDEAVAGGVEAEALQARMRSLGVRKEDVDLDYDEAKRRGAERLAAPKAAPMQSPPLSRGDAEMAAARTLRPGYDALAAYTAPSGPKPPAPLAPRPSPLTRSADEPRVRAPDVAEPGAAEPAKRDMVPRSNLYANTVEGGIASLPAGLARGVLGDSKFTRALEATPEIMDAVMDGEVKERLPGIRKRVAERVAEPGLSAFTEWGADPELNIVKKDPATGKVVPQPLNEDSAPWVPSGWRAGAENSAQVRKDRSVDATSVGPAAVGARVANFGADVMDNIKGVLGLLNDVAGVSMVQRDEPAGKRLFDLGQAVVEQGAGSTGDLAGNLFSTADDASWQTAPLSTFFAVVDPAQAAIKRMPGGAAALKKAHDGFRDVVVTPIVEQAVNRVVSADTRADTMASLKRWLVDGISQADPRMTAIVEDIIHGTDEVKAKAELALEQLARQIEQGKVTLDTPEMRKVPLTVVPPGVVREGEAAARQVAKAEDAAGVQGGVADAAAQTADAARGLRKDVKGAQAVAERAEARIAPIAERDLAAPQQAPQQRARDATLAQAGIQTAEATKALDADPAAGMAREVSTMARGQARKAEKAADRLADDLDGAGERPPVAVGDVYLTPDRAPVGESVTAQQPGASQYGQQQTLRDLFPDATDAEIADIGKSVSVASALRKEAEAAGFDGSRATIQQLPAQNPAAGAMAEAVSKWNLPPDATLYDVARAAAENIKDRAVGMGGEGGLEGVLTDQLRQMGVPDSAADVSAKWLLAEVEARDHTKRLEQPQGTIRTPAPETTVFETQADGSIREMPEAGRLRERMSAAEQPPDLTARRALQEAQERVDRTVQQMPPRTYRAVETAANAALADFAKVMRDAGYHSDMTQPGTDVAVKPMKLAEMPPDAFTTVVDDHLKQLRPERIMQRLLDPMEGDSTQLQQIPVVRNASLERLDANAKKAGLTDKQRNALLATTAEQWAHPGRSSGISKQRFVEVKHRMPDGQVVDLWTRKDYADVRNGLKPQVLAKAVAQRVRQIGNQMISQMATYGDLHAVFGEINRFRRTPEGETIQETLGSVKDYATEVARRVLVEGEVRPGLAPFRGELIAGALRDGAERYIAEWGVKPEAIEALAKRMEKLQAADGRGKFKGSNLQDLWNQSWREQFDGTQGAPDFANVYLDPGVMPALRAELQARHGINSLLGPAGLLGALSSRAKAGLVAESLPTLLNNGLSNIVLDLFHEANPAASLSDPMQMVLDLKAFQDGHTSMLDPAQLRRIRDLAQAGIVQSTQLAKDVGETNVWRRAVETFPGLRAIEAYSATTKGKAGRLPALFNDFSSLQQEMYQKLGDSPFRLAKAARTYDHLGTFFDNMEAGTTVEVPIGTARKVIVEANGDGRFTIKDASGPRAKLEGRQVAADSPELGRIKALAGKVEQEALYFDYGRIGTWGKFLRGSGAATALSGIFSWYMKALDIPGVKKGLGAKALSGPHQYATTSPAVQALQAEARLALAAKRAVMEAGIQGVMQDEQKRKELSRMFGFDRTMAAAFVSASTSDDHANVREVGNLNFAGPSLAMLGMVEGAANWLAFDGIRDDPDRLRAFLRPDKEARLLAATGETDPKVAEAKLLAMGPEKAKAAYAEAKRKQEMAAGQMFRYASGKDTNESKVIEMMGLGGAALFGPLARMAAAARSPTGNYGFGDALKDWSKQLLGANIFRAIDATAAAAEEAGVPGAGGFSNRGRQESRQGFNAATMDPNVASLGRYIVRTLAGVGAQEILVKEVQTGGGNLQGRLQTNLEQTSAALTKGLLTEAKRQADLGNPEAKETVRIIRDFVIKPEIQRLRKAIEPQFQQLKRRALSSKPAVASQRSAP